MASEVNGGNSFENKYFKLQNTIDLTEYIALHGGSWVSIGYSGKTFKGNFDGDGFRITGLTISGGSNEASGGLFGETDGSSLIKNLGILLKRLNPAFGAADLSRKGAGHGVLQPVVLAVVGGLQRAKPRNLNIKVHLFLDHRVSGS